MQQTHVFYERGTHGAVVKDVRTWAPKNLGLNPSSNFYEQQTLRQITQSLWPWQKEMRLALSQEVVLRMK